MYIADSGFTTLMSRITGRELSNKDAKAILHKWYQKFLVPALRTVLQTNTFQYNEQKEMERFAQSWGILHTTRGMTLWDLYTNVWKPLAEQYGISRHNLIFMMLTDWPTLSFTHLEQKIRQSPERIICIPCKSPISQIVKRSNNTYLLVMPPKESFRVVPYETLKIRVEKVYHLLQKVTTPLQKTCQP